MPTETLDSSPTLGVLYGRALLTARSGGDTLPDRRLELPARRIDPDALADYEHVCGFDVGGAMPPTYPHMLAFPLHMAIMTDGSFPFPAIGTVHLENSITEACLDRIQHLLTVFFLDPEKGFAISVKHLE